MFFSAVFSGLDHEFLADLVLNFLIAGRDTTAQAMSWCLFLLMQHPHVEERILQDGWMEISWQVPFEILLSKVVLP